MLLHSCNILINNKRTGSSNKKFELLHSPTVVFRQYAFIPTRSYPLTKPCHPLLLCTFFSHLSQIQSFPSFRHFFTDSSTSLRSFLLSPYGFQHIHHYAFTSPTIIQSSNINKSYDFLAFSSSHHTIP